MISKPLENSNAPILLARVGRAVDVERLREDLREGGIEEMVGTLLETFVQDCPGRLAALELAVLSGSAEAVRSAAHAFKSGAGTIRATFLADRLQEMEAAGKANELTRTGALMETIRAEHLAVLCELERTRPDNVA
jgi:HPt (histidine-containing phosphotransfer) domain-containing protein